MKTRLLETKEVFKGLVKKAELREQGRTHAVFATSGVLAVKNRISSADSAMLDQARLAGVGQPVAGTLRLDVLSDTAFRVRYAEGATVPGNDTPMIAAWPAPPTACRLDTPAKAPSSRWDRS